VLYNPELFEPLTETVWDEAAIRGRVEQIADEHEAAYDADSLWPAPEWESVDTRPPLATLYSGASGIAWALARLGRDSGAVASRALEAWRVEPDYDPSLEPAVYSDASLYFGETGPLLVAWLLTGEAGLADDLYARVRENVDAQANELMWGRAGTMLVAKAALERTGEERWAEAWQASATVLLERRDNEGLWDAGPGAGGRFLGPAHGSSTIAQVLGDTGPTADALARYAVVEDGLANWPPRAAEELADRNGKIRVQWCHGAAGIVASAADYLDEELALAGAELTWRAGPHHLDQGYGLCHGTAGNGYAFLKVFERTGDELWLDRARRFAVHALEQVDRLPPRYSLMTGSIGVALFAADCLEARATFPIVDVL
jgi:lantibiotic modifying enzyme